MYTQLYGFAMSIAIRFSRDQEDAADILSHAFIKVFKSIHSFDRGKGNFHGWIKQIVIREALDHLKKRNRYSAKELAEADERGIDAEVISKMDADALMQVIRQLPPATHTVFILYVTEGYSHQQIAESLNISTGTSKWHLSEARRLLQQKLKNYTPN